MNPTTIRQYMKLTEFLGKILGPDYEVVLHDLSDPDNSIVAIANGHISGRGLDSPIPGTALQVLSDRSYETKDYKINYSSVAVGKKILRSSTFYIKGETGAIEGMLCINFDDQRYQALSTLVLKLCHPDAFVDANFVYNPEKMAIETVPQADAAERPREQLATPAEGALAQILKRKGLASGRLTQAEKLEIVEALKNKGAFLVKGAVKEVADQLGCSQATIYRYLSQAGGGARK